MPSGKSGIGCERYLYLQLERMVLAKQDMHFALRLCSEPLAAWATGRDRFPQKCGGADGCVSTAVYSLLF